MRERTPSVDDTPKRAPPAPPREAASADVAGSKTSSETVDVFSAVSFSPTTTASPSTAATTTTSASSPSSVDGRMVASTHNLDDLGVSHPANANGDRQQQQEKHGYAYRSTQTAQDKRSRLSNVINNLRKKVPDSRSVESPRKEEDGRNSVERNLETLEKYVMTVLNGVIKDEENDDKEVRGKKEAETGKEQEKLTDDQEDEDSKGPIVKFEPSKPNESRTEIAVLSELSEKVENKEPPLEYRKLANRDESLRQSEDSSCSGITDSQGSYEEDTKKQSCETETGEMESLKGNKCSAKETKHGDQSVQEAKNESQDEEKKENRSLGAIIMERLNDHQPEEKENRELVAENVELRNVCRDLLNDVLNGINQLIDENSQEKEETKTTENSLEFRNHRSQDLSTTSLHCSLPLDKVASVLQNCQSNEPSVPHSPSSPSSSSSSQSSKSPCKPSPPTVRHLCLYCDRKFLSISLRQRHTERVHQQGGGRRSERNSRKPSQNCQYCSDKCAENLEGLFQHMVGNHGDKYHACVQCFTRYLTREALAVHMTENHGVNADRSSQQVQEKMKESCKEGNQNVREKAELSSTKERRSEELDHEHRMESILLKPILQTKDAFSNPGSPEFDSSFYSSVSCNIRENLLHHLDGKLQSTSTTIVSSTSTSTADAKPQQQQSYYEHNVNQIQFPIDISLTAATPVYSKEYASEDYENSSEYAQKPGKSNRSHPRRVSFEKYNFPRKYDGKEQWTCSIKDLSKFDISTQLSLRKKQQLLKERITLNRLQQIPLLGMSATTDIARDEQSISRVSNEIENIEGTTTGRKNAVKSTERESVTCEIKKVSQATEFTVEFGSFLRLRKWDEKTSSEAAKKQEVVYAELTGEWSRPRVYICGACATKHVTLREMEDHKATTHPNVWCSHFEFSGDQRELYKHLFLPGKDVPTAKAKAANLAEKVCTKCTRNCNTLPELHRHMLECGGDQAWLLGLFGNGKKKCKWRPFGSRSRRRRQRGMKRNIQNSQTPRMNTPKEKQPPGPRVRPSDRESIQKMLANLPPKRATRKVMQDSALRAQGRLRNVQTRSRPRRVVGENTTASRMTRNKAVLRNKLLKNAKSFQRHRCRIDNISAVIESVVKNYNAEDARFDEKRDPEKFSSEKDAKEKTGENSRVDDVDPNQKGNKVRIARGPRVLSKKRNVKPKDGATKSADQPRKPYNTKVKVKATSKAVPEAKIDSPTEPSKSPKSVKSVSKGVEKDAEAKHSVSPMESKSPNLSTKGKSSVQTTPKKKRPVDPVASLNASIKAKSQLRTHDGKFARNPNKIELFQKLPEMRSPVVSRQSTKGKGAGSESSITRSKLRGVSRGRNSDQSSKRTTRLSSDSDKMPTLEPAVQVPVDGEEYVEASTNDLPILSPVTSASGSEKTIRGRSLFGKNQDDSTKGNENEIAEASKITTGESPEEGKYQKLGKTRRSKGDTKNLEKSLENIDKVDSLKEKKGVKEKFKRKNAAGKTPPVEEKKVTVAKVSEDASPKKEKQKKEEEATKTLETRSNLKTNPEKTLDVDSKAKVPKVPFEVKKLIGPDVKEDLLTKLVLTSRTISSKRCLRQSISKAKTDQSKDKSRRDSESEKTSLDSESISIVPIITAKKEKADLRRKSLRNTKKKFAKDDKPPLEEVDKSRVNEIKTAIRGRRSSSSGENKSTIDTDQASSEEDQAKPAVEVAVVEQSADNESASKKRQTRGSLLNTNEGDTQSKETCSELNDMSLKKNTSLGKRRGRIKSSDVGDRRNADVSRRRSEEVDKSPIEENETNSDRKRVTVPEDDHVAANDGKEEDEDEDAKVDQLEDSSKNANPSLNHLQLETSNSIDSGKENSLETVLGVQKLRVGRPRKSWGSRREKTSKRSLNNVIGILTEGMNIPVESQQSVVLTVQTTLDNAGLEGILQSNVQQSDDGGSRSTNLDKTDKSETANDPDRLADETDICVPSSKETTEQLQSTEVSIKETSVDDTKRQKADSSSEDARPRSPTTDIILDLSRRKQKGKGSFLEKIVSKIAKQKDALLEGDVGSLLDTAADELTSILDEVGPGLSESAENSKAAKKHQVQKAGREEVEKKSSKKCQESIGVDSDHKVETEDVKIDEIESQKETIIPEVKESGKETIDGVDTVDGKETNDIPIDLPGQEIVDQLLEIEDRNNSSVVQKTSFDDLNVQDRVPTETDTSTNRIPLPIFDSIAKSTPDCSEQTHSPEQKDTSSKQDREVGIGDAKVKRKSKKRSLEGNSPKKNKRKSIDPEENSEESLVPEVLNLADIMKLIDRPEPVPSTKENVENGSSSEATAVRVQPGKRKTLNDEPEAKDSSKSKACDGVQADVNDGAKKLKTDATKSTEDHATRNKENDEVVRNTVKDTVEMTKEVQMNFEEKDTCTLQMLGKRNTWSIDETQQMNEEEDVSSPRVSRKKNKSVNEVQQINEERDISSPRISRKKNKSLDEVQGINDEEDISFPRVSGKKNKSIDEDQPIPEEKDSLSQMKRRSAIETVKQYVDTESPIRRSSKRKSLPEEQTKQSSEEDTSSKVYPESTASEATAETTRRRSSRTKIISKSEEKFQKPTDNEPASDIGNTVVADNSKLPSNHLPEERESTKDDVSILQSMVLPVMEDNAKKVEEDSISKDPENPKIIKKDPVEEIPNPDVKNSPKDASIVPKVTKKRGRKNKSLDNERSEITIDSENTNSSRENSDSKPETRTTEMEALDRTLSRKSLRTSRSNEKVEQKNPSDANDSQTVSPGLEHFKVPEVTEVLQHTKKRTYKKKSTIDEHADVGAVSTVEPEAELSEARKTPIEKDEQLDNPYQKEPSEGRRRSSRNSNRDQSEPESPSSPGSIVLAKPGRKRSSRKKQLSSEDLSGEGTLNQRAESVDCLSETSCVSESSYFRKKRFSKRKKVLDVSMEDAQTDTSVTDSESIDTEKNVDRRQSLKRRAKKNISFLEYQFDLVDDFDIPDIQNCLLEEEVLKNVEEPIPTAVEDDKEETSEEKEDKSENKEDTSEDKAAATETSNVEDEDNSTKEKTVKESVTEENPTENSVQENEASMDVENSLEEDDEESKEEEKSNHDGAAQLQEEFQTPKKRAAGNYVVVHKKTGEILIVEKRKKLTKEAARFFCDVCATSFTRKSSLKKHNQSQSHLVQMIKYKKDKTFDGGAEETCSASWDNETSSQNEASNDGNKSPDEPANLSLESKDDQKEEDTTQILDNSRDFDAAEGDSCFAASMEQDFLIDSHVTRQRSLEDELLDEEICKITENMSHDEYVLTEHSSPAPESTSTPIKAVIKKASETIKKKKHEKKKEKGKKKHTVSEHLPLDTSESEAPLDSTVTVLGTSVSIKISRTSHSNASETPSAATVASERVQDNSSIADLSSHSESRTKVSVPDIDNFQESITSPNLDLDAAGENVARLKPGKRLDQEKKLDEDYSGNKVYELQGEFDKKTDNFSSTLLEDKPVSKESQPHERLSLKFIINKRSIELSREVDTESNGENIDQGSDDKLENVDSVGDRCNKESIEEPSHCKFKPEHSDGNAIVGLSKSLRKGCKRNTETIEDAFKNVSEETQQADRFDDLEEKSTKTSRCLADETANDVKSKIESAVRTTRHGKSKKGKTKKRFEKMANPLSTRRTSTSKLVCNQSKQVSDETTLSETEMKQTSTDYPQSFHYTTFDETETDKPEFASLDSQFEKNFDPIKDSTSLAKSENETESDKLESVEKQRILCSDSKASEETWLEKVEETKEENFVENNNEGLDRENKMEPFRIDEDDQDSSSSSLADKPLSQILLMTDEILQMNNEQGKEKERGLSLNLSKMLEESKSKGYLEIEDTSSKVAKFLANESSPNIDESTDQNDKYDDTESFIGKEIESKIDECEHRASKFVEDSSKSAKISLECKKNETVPKTKNIPDEKEAKASSGRKSSTSDRQSLKKISKTHKSFAKDGHRKSKTKKSAVRSKISDLTSESDDSGNEDKIESQNKSKIVKSVFGRVFGGEKADKVKEVLNDWVSKSEEDSNASRNEPRCDSDDEQRANESLDSKNEDRNAKRHSISSSSSSNSKKRSYKKSRKSSSSDRAKERSSVSEGQEEHRSGKHGKLKSSSNSRKKNDTESSNYYFLVLPPTSCRPSKKRAEERISKAFEDELLETNVKGQKLSKEKEANYELRNQSKSDSNVKDSGYGLFNCDEDTSKLVSTEEPVEEDQKLAKRRKSSTFKKGKSKNEDDDWRELTKEKDTKEDNNESGDENEASTKDLPERETLDDQLSVDLESSRSCSSAVPSSVRNRSPSLDRNSQTTRDSDLDEEEDRDEGDMGHRRISPLFICGTPRSSIDSTSDSENEENENTPATESSTRKRSCSEFSGEKVVIRSPSSTHKTEMVTIAPTDAIEDNALDVPQEIETAKPRQGKVLNFDEELFVECCSRLKATTENELRGAKKIKLDHNEGYHRRDDQQQGIRGPRDRWRDVESQNSLGSLLESVNQLLGEEMYSTRERDYPKRGGRNLRSEHSSRSASPDMSRADNLGYEDSLDVAFEHNNKLRDKIQQRMRESENLIASTFGQKSNNEVLANEHPTNNKEQDILRNTYSHLQDQGHLPGGNLSNGVYNDELHVRSLQVEQGNGKMSLDSSGSFKSKMNSALGGLLDKALSNLLHSNGKHDHNGSTPMKVLAELACARAPTSTAGDSVSQEDVQPEKTTSPQKDSIQDSNPVSVPKEQQKKIRNPIKELFEKKKEMNERKQQEKSKTEAALRELNVHRQHKTKKIKKHQEFPLIRRNEHGGLVERKKRRDGFERKEEFASSRIKDVYDFDEEESQIEPKLGSVMSYRSRPGYEVSCLKTKEIDVAGLMSKAIGDSLENGKTGDALSIRLESMIDRKFKELEKFAPKTKGALKSFQSEEQQRQVTGPMDEFVERKPSRPKRSTEQNLKHSKLKRRSKNSKKRPRNAWYEYDSSDEYRTAVKTEDVGVGISKSQRTCSKGKQNIFAELYTSSESEFDGEDIDFETKRQQKAKKSAKKATELEDIDQGQELDSKYCLENDDHVDEWEVQDLKNDSNKNDCDNKKSESEMSDQPLVIDERKDLDEQRNSDEETENQYEGTFALDDLYREDSSVADTDVDEPTITESQNIPDESRTDTPVLPQEEKVDDKTNYLQDDELIPLEEALDLLDQAETDLGMKYDDINKDARPVEDIDTVVTTEFINETFNPIEESTEKCLSPAEEQEDDEQDEQDEQDDDLLALPEKLSTNEKPQKESDNLPLHVFLSRKVQESKKRKEQQLKKMQEEQERILMDFQPTRRQRKCAIGKQGLLAEISSSDEETSPKDSKKTNEKPDHEKPRKPKRESKEKRKERYIEKKHEQMIAKEQKAIEEEILRELGKKKESLSQNSGDTPVNLNGTEEPESVELSDDKTVQDQTQKKKHQTKEKQKKSNKTEEDLFVKKNEEVTSDPENNSNKSTHLETNHEDGNNQESSEKQKKYSKSPTKPKKNPKGDAKVSTTNKKCKITVADKSKNRTDSKGSKEKERRSSSGRRDSDDEELKTTKSWNKVEEGVGVAIGRRKRAAANQLYYWSSSSDEEEVLEVAPTVEEEEDDRQEQHGWIVGDSHKRMITMLAMEKQLKEKRRRSEDEFEPGKAKSKKHRNSTS
ncbi:uncharacterized protein LOC128875663 [Hylaeus volcanicus]|uniref:uncharacterized protein LOC128875663 n=1 Tax=Hylaeus volcanicus TaxID=313075 RepID=UPI0023B8276A|nr:uncharacterized protein LOC128875663 [Hylaeus volcanicus]XP_053977437.1 uncharacterized protein LOC128875663 [Hylaeus volcanicus]